MTFTYYYYVHAYGLGVGVGYATDWSDHETTMKHYRW